MLIWLAFSSKLEDLEWVFEPVQGPFCVFFASWNYSYYTTRKKYSVITSGLSFNPFSTHHFSVSKKVATI